MTRTINLAKAHDAEFFEAVVASIEYNEVTWILNPEGHPVAAICRPHEVAGPSALTPDEAIEAARANHDLLCAFRLNGRGYRCDCQPSSTE